MADNHGKNGGNDDPGGGDSFTITVNEQPVPITGHRHTGLEIKQAALAAGLSVDLDFVLSEEKGPGKHDIVGDGQELTLTKKSRFELIPNDDHS
jgi:hypothetical protein